MMGPVGMPDLIPHSFWRCASGVRKTFTSSRDESVTYVAECDGFEVHCTCPGFQYKKECRHAKEVYEAACRWNEEWNSMGFTIVKTDDGDHRCPACGGPVTSFVDMV
jgi:hypothetical protein